MQLKKLRGEYHKKIFSSLLSLDKNGVPSNADKHSKLSVELALGIVKEIALEVSSEQGSGQTSGKSFEKITSEYLQQAFKLLLHLWGGKCHFFFGASIASFEQYDHLEFLSKILKTNPELRATLGDYIVAPDIVIGRLPIEESEINKQSKIIKGKETAIYTPIRKINSTKPILHASISCKWTIRSDRSQNARTEGLNLIRNRKGHTPHIAIVTAEPYPQRLASVALGTGDIDCVYHFALPELLTAAKESENVATIEMMEMLVQGKRLRDISDLPFDLIA